VSGVKVERRIAHLVVFSEDTVADALAKLGRNQRRVLFCVDEAGVLEGVLTDGDVRRWLLQVDPIDLQRPVLEAANPDFTWVPAGAAGSVLGAGPAGAAARRPRPARRRRRP
jgi:N-acetylneuraminate synthase